MEDNNAFAKAMELLTTLEPPKFVFSIEMNSETYKRFSKSFESFEDASTGPLYGGIRVLINDNLIYNEGRLFFSNGEVEKILIFKE